VIDKIAPATPQATPAKADPKLIQAAKAFEAVFARQLMSSMRSAKLTEDDLFGSSATEQFQDMADSKVADSMAEKGTFGIAELLTQQFAAKGGTK
jgi:peptidoglycan hydrolase FlgJ